MLLTILIVLTAAILVACNSQVNLTMQQFNDRTVWDLSIVLSHAEETMLNNSARTNGIRHNKVDFRKYGVPFQTWEEGDAWTVVDYIRVLAIISRSDYEFISISGQNTNNPTILNFRRIARIAPAEDENQGSSGCGGRQELPPHIQQTGDNFFVRTFAVTTPNPFNEHRASYDQPAGGTLFHDLKYGFSPDTIITLPHPNYPLGERDVLDEAEEGGFEVIRNPANPNMYILRRTFLPAFSEIFPIVSTSPIAFNPDRLAVNFSVITSQRWQVSDDVDVSESRLEGNFTYTFSAFFDGSDENMLTYTYRRVNPYGWYVIAVAMGGIITGAIILSDYLKKRKKPKFYNSGSGEIEVFSSQAD